MPLFVLMPAPVRMMTRLHASERMKAETPFKVQEGRASGRSPGYPIVSVTTPPPRRKRLGRSVLSSSPVRIVKGSEGAGSSTMMVMVRCSGSRSSRSLRTCSRISGRSRMKSGTSSSSCRAAREMSSRTEMDSRVRLRDAHSQPRGLRSSASSTMRQHASGDFSRTRSSPSPSLTVSVSLRVAMAHKRQDSLHTSERLDVVLCF
mmetsp:Transcript_14894/g.36223  ORF Transcript_14894/g.36223 Transcript_14894/m.36223 type:complete len:204 (-) Transcript_14894:11-622(-)